MDASQQREMDSAKCILSIVIHQKTILTKNDFHILKADQHIFDV